MPPISQLAPAYGFPGSPSGLPAASIFPPMTRRLFAGNLLVIGLVLVLVSLLLLMALAGGAGPTLAPTDPHCLAYPDLMPRAPFCWTATAAVPL